MPDNSNFLFAAFAVTWLLIFGYLLFMNSRIGGLRQDVEALRDELDARASATPVATAEGSGEDTTGEERQTLAGTRRT